MGHWLITQGRNFDYGGGSGFSGWPWPFGELIQAACHISKASSGTRRICIDSDLRSANQATIDRNPDSCQGFM